MKKLILSAVAILMAAATINAQENGDVAIKNDVKNLNQQEKEIKKEKRHDKITLRKLKGDDASYQSKQQFFIDFGNITDVTWTRAAYFDEAIFTKDGKKMKAFYDNDAQLVGTTSPAAFTDIPKSAQKEISKQYKDYTVKKVIFYDDNEANDTDMILYGSQFDDEDNYFVELTGNSNNKNIILHVSMDGNVSYFTEIK